MRPSDPLGDFINANQQNWSGVSASAENSPAQYVSFSAQSSSISMSGAVISGTGSANEFDNVVNDEALRAETMPLSADTRSLLESIPDVPTEASNFAASLKEFEPSFLERNASVLAGQKASADDAAWFAQMAPALSKGVADNIAQSLQNLPPPPAFTISNGPANPLGLPDSPTVWQPLTPQQSWSQLQTQPVGPQLVPWDGQVGVSPGDKFSEDLATAYYAPMAASVLLLGAEAIGGARTLAAIGAVTGGGLDAAGQYMLNGEVRPGEVVAAAAIGALTTVGGAQTKFIGNSLLGGAGAAALTSFNNS